MQQLLDEGPFFTSPSGSASVKTLNNNDSYIALYPVKIDKLAALSVCLVRLRFCTRIVAHVKDTMSTFC